MQPNPIINSQSSYCLSSKQLLAYKQLLTQMIAILEIPLHSMPRSTLFLIVFCLTSHSFCLTVEISKRSAVEKFLSRCSHFLVNVISSHSFHVISVKILKLVSAYSTTPHGYLPVLKTLIIQN